MPDTTVKRGYSIPKLDGSDFLDPDRWRLPIIAIDADVDEALARGAAGGTYSGVNGDNAFAIVGTNPPVGTKKTRFRESAVVNIAGGNGKFSIVLNTPFAHGITYLAFTAGDVAANLGFVVVELGLLTLNTLTGRAYTLTGVPIANGVAVRVGFDVEGW